MTAKARELKAAASRFKITAPRPITADSDEEDTLMAMANRLAKAARRKMCAAQAARAASVCCCGGGEHEAERCCSFTTHLFNDRLQRG